jgi:hypothetical protein
MFLSKEHLVFFLIFFGIVTIFYFSNDNIKASIVQNCVKKCDIKSISSIYRGIQNKTYASNTLDTINKIYQSCLSKCKKN